MESRDCRHRGICNPNTLGFPPHARERPDICRIYKDSEGLQGITRYRKNNSSRVSKPPPSALCQEATTGGFMILGELVNAAACGLRGQVVAVEAITPRPLRAWCAFIESQSKGPSCNRNCNRKPTRISAVFSPIDRIYKDCGYLQGMAGYQKNSASLSGGPGVAGGQRLAGPAALVCVCDHSC
jgi:hypothetical protein